MHAYTCYIFKIKKMWQYEWCENEIVQENILPFLGYLIQIYSTLLCDINWMVYFHTSSTATVQSKSLFVSFNYSSIDKTETISKLEYWSLEDEKNYFNVFLGNVFLEVFVWTRF